MAKLSSDKARFEGLVSSSNTKIQALRSRRTKERNRSEDKELELLKGESQQLPTWLQTLRAFEARLGQANDRLKTKKEELQANIGLGVEVKKQEDRMANTRK